MSYKNYTVEVTVTRRYDIIAKEGELRYLKDVAEERFHDDDEIRNVRPCKIDVVDCNELSEAEKKEWGEV